MTKKKKNRKHVAQNFRNWFLNQTYKFNIKFFGKLIIKQFKLFNLLKSNSTLAQKKEMLIALLYKNISILTSLLDKSIKKNILKLNTVNKKKEKLSNIINFIKFN